MLHIYKSLLTPSQFSENAYIALCEAGKNHLDDIQRYGDDDPIGKRCHFCNLKVLYNSPGWNREIYEEIDIRFENHDEDCMIQCARKALYELGTPMKLFQIVSTIELHVGDKSPKIQTFSAYDYNVADPIPENFAHNTAKAWLYRFEPLETSHKILSSTFRMLRVFEFPILPSD
jgi:hypothetical protein